MIMELLIDADSAIYKAGCANETRGYHVVDEETGRIVADEQYIKDARAVVLQLEKSSSCTFRIDKWKEAGPLGHTLANTKLICKKMTELEHSDRQMYIGGEGNFRYDIYPCYKGHRDSMDRPIHEEEIKEYLVKYWGAQLVDGEEADDRVSYMQCLSEYKSTCIVSIDKDLLNTPGYNYNYDTRKLTFISQTEADLTFYRQLLSGDSTDHIPGLRGVAAKTAEKLLPSWRPLDEMKQVICDEYEKRYGENWLEAVNLNGSLLWMRRKPNEIWDFDYE